MNLFIDAMSKTRSFLLIHVPCFQSLIWTADYSQCGNRFKRGVWRARAATPFGGSLGNGKRTGSRSWERTLPA